VFIFSVIFLFIIGIIYSVVPDNSIHDDYKKNLINTAIFFGIAAIVGFGLLLICPHKVYKELKLKEDEKMKKDKIL
jgi:hypothetical protein